MGRLAGNIQDKLQNGMNMMQGGKAMEGLSQVRYNSITNIMSEFKKSGHKDSEWNRLDQPGHLFFKVIFHFWNGDFAGNGGIETGLLAPTWDWESSWINPNEGTITAENNSTDQSQTPSSNQASQAAAAAATNNSDKTAITQNKDGGNQTTTETLSESNPVDDSTNTQQDSANDKVSAQEHFMSKQRQIIDDEVNAIMKRQRKDGKGDYTKPANQSVHNSAYNFLIRNDELERASKLKAFIELLSNISSYSPWYFYEITGLDNIIERPFKVNEDAYKVEARKSFSIKCMPDAMDNRVGMLLDLYRDVIYSQTWHRVILPANLRKFDMSIYIFESPITNLHHYENKWGIMDSSSASKDHMSTKFPVSYKRIELHDCEIDYNSTKTGYNSLKNDEGFQQIFEIPIFVGDVYEHRYNVFMDLEAGDYNRLDQALMRYSDATANSNSQSHTPDIWSDSFVDVPAEINNDVITDLDNRINSTERGKVDVFNIVDDLVSINGNTNAMSAWVNTQLLGNLHKMSITDLTSNASKLMANIRNGNVGGIKNNFEKFKDMRENGWVGSKKKKEATKTNFFSDEAYDGKYAGTTKDGDRDVYLYGGEFGQNINTRDVRHAHSDLDRKFDQSSIGNKIFNPNEAKVKPEVAEKYKTEFDNNIADPDDRHAHSDLDREFDKSSVGSNIMKKVTKDYITLTENIFK